MELKEVSDRIKEILVEKKKDMNFAIEQWIKPIKEKAEIQIMISEDSEDPMDTVNDKTVMQASEIKAALCKIDVTKKIIRVVPWDSKSKNYKKDSARILQWKDNTELIWGENKLTMAQLASGKLLDKDIKKLDDLHRERAILYVVKTNGDEAIQKIVGISQWH
jgi:hypothetical protein